MRRDLTHLIGEGHANESFADGFTRMFDDGDRADPSLISYSNFCLGEDFDYSLPCNVRELTVLSGVYVTRIKNRPRRVA